MPSSLSSAPGPKMTFAQRMMANMGHVEGEGLGRHQNGITAPIEAVSNNGRRGLGHEEGLIPASAFESTTRQRDWFENDITSKFVIIDNLDPDTGAATVSRLFNHTECKPKEIFVIGGSRAYLEFESNDDAEIAVAEQDDRRSNHDYSKISVRLVAPEEVPEPKDDYYGPRLSTFLREHEENLQVKSCTVLLKNLPNHEQRCVNTMTGDHEEFEYSGIRVVDDGEVLVKFYSPDNARHFAGEWDGTYFKTRTVYAKCVPDSEIDDFIETENLEKEHKPKAAIFVTNVPQGSSIDDVRDVFYKYEIDNVNMIPRPGVSLSQRSYS
jgi:hypothetical protein